MSLLSLSQSSQSFPTHPSPLLLFSCLASPLYSLFVMLSSDPSTPQFPNCREQLRRNCDVFAKIVFQRCPSCDGNEEPGLPGCAFPQLPLVTGIVLSWAERGRMLPVPMCLQIIRAHRLRAAQGTGHKDQPFPAASCVSPPPKPPLSTQKRVTEGPRDFFFFFFGATHCCVHILLSSAVLMQMKMREGLRELLKQQIKRHFFVQRVASPHPWKFP